MYLKKVIRKRQSVRSFTNDDVDDKLIKKLLSFANLAPSAGNLQAREFIVIKNEKVKKILYNATFAQNAILSAPVDIVVCSNLKRIASYGKRGEDLYCIQDAAAAIENLLLSVVNEGLSACWIGAFKEDKVKKILNIPSHVRPVAIIPIGFPDEKNKKTSRIDIEKITHIERW
ncbi:MAG: nitroreductase family protein [Candidatus Thermoplasmatota archaeon]